MQPEQYVIYIKNIMINTELKMDSDLEILKTMME